MIYSFLITLREGLEASLVVGIMLAYLAKTGRRSGFGPVLWGAGSALVASLLGGWLLQALTGGLTGAAMEIFEGGMMLAAAALLTWMILWMQRQARSLRAEIQGRLESADGSYLALAGVAFTVVIREGLETVLFLLAGASRTDSVAAYGLGALAGGLVAVVLGYLLYRGGIRLDLRRFFTLTGWLLIFFAAGMIANGFKELHEAQVVPRVVGHVWDTYDLLPDNSQVGRLLAALLGYDASPSLVQVAGYLGYLVVTGFAFWRGIRTPQNRPPVAA